MPITQVTLCYIVKEGKVLLIHKLRGIGAGKLNGPGGKVEAGETPLEAAVRETREETGVVPTGLELRGELWFHFSNDQTSQCFVYLATGFQGEPQPSAEAIPEWFPVELLPYGQMWADDRYWLPLLLEGKKFTANVVVDGENAHPPVFSSIIND